jgi:hypothetical protein
LEDRLVFVEQGPGVEVEEGIIRVVVEKKKFV